MGWSYVVLPLVRGETPNALPIRLRYIVNYRDATIISWRRSSMTCRRCVTPKQSCAPHRSLFRFASDARHRHDEPTQWCPVRKQGFWLPNVSGHDGDVGWTNPNPRLRRGGGLPEPAAQRQSAWR